MFISGNVYKRVDDKWVPATADQPTDCICGVKSTGAWKEYIGVCTMIDADRDIVQFAPHGDFMFTVSDTAKFKIGDTILYDGRILNDD